MTEATSSSATEQFSQRAFIAHSQGDAHWGEWLQKALQSYHVPGRLVGRDSRDGPVPKRLVPVYRDDNEIKASIDIGATRRNLLQESRYLIVICSPESAQSPWVNEEVLEFKRLGRENRILCLIVDGEPNATDKPDITESECFCDGLRYKVDEKGQLTDQRFEPIAADLRPGKDGKDGARLKILAGLLGVSFDDLRQRDLRRRRTRRAEYGVIFLLALMGMVFIGIEFKQQALENAYQEAEYAAQEAQRLVNDGEAEIAIQTILNNLPPDYSKSQHPVIDELTWVLEDAIHQVPLQAILRGHKAEIFNLQFDSSGDRLLTAARDWSVRVWDVASGTVTAQHDIANLYAVRFSPSGHLVASADYDNTVRLWDPDTGQDITVLTGHAERVISVAFNTEGSKILTGSEDGTARLWDVESGEQLALYPDHGDAVDYVGFNGTGNIIITITTKIIRFWDPEASTPFSTVSEPAEHFRVAKITASGDRLITIPLVVMRVSGI